jgi:hypothetical protein
MLSRQPTPPPEWWRYPESPRRQRSWGRMVGFALLAVVAACGLVVLAFAALFVMAMAAVGSNK